ncbi:hypothetical protein PAMP_023925 [Pampus punctatissimus]
MDRDLLRQCLTFHGESLFNKLKCEQTENPDFQAVVSELCKATYESRGEAQGSPLVEQFIARKADILFCPTWKTTTLQEEEHEEEEAAEPCAIMPPVELFMEVSYDERRAMLYRDLERGDLVVGRINNIREYGFFLTLLCMAGGLKRDIEDLELSALCHIREIPSTGSHDDPLSYYQIGDIIRAGVKDIDRYQEKITVSLQQASLSPSLEHIKLGVITREELPIHYSRSVRAASDSSETYECILMGCHGYHNPSVVDYLLKKVGVSDIHPPSMMRGLQSVRAGVDHFKHARHVEAMNEYNKALEIDTNNVEALVARGALYANKGSIIKAITDFELALVSCPDHRNAKKYLCQTLVERGKQMKKKRKRSASSSLSSSSASGNSSLSSSSSRRRSKKKKKKRRRSERENKHHRRVSSRESRRSEEGKSEKERKEREEEELEWYPAPPNTSATFLNQKEGLEFGDRDEEEVEEKMKEEEVREDRRISQLYSLSAASEDEESDSSRRERKKGDREESRPRRRRNTLSQSLEREERSGERKDDNRRNSDSKKRSGLDENKKRKVSCSSVESEYSQKSSFKSEYSGNSGSASKYSERRRSSFNGGRYKNKVREDIWEVEEVKMEKESKKGRSKEESGSRSGGASSKGLDSDVTPKKELPANLLDIFNQIAQFEKEKGVRPKK